MSGRESRDGDGYAASPFRPARKAPLLQRTFLVAGDLAGYRSKAAAT